MTVLLNNSSFGNYTNDRSIRIIFNRPLYQPIIDLDFYNPGLDTLGLHKSTLRYFGIGVCLEKQLKNRIVVPVGNEHGRAVGYLNRGLSTEDATWAAPRDSYIGDTINRFDPSRLVYHGHPLSQQLRYLVVVQDFFTVWRLFEQGIHRIVGLFGSDPSPYQLELITKMVATNGFVILLTGSDSISRIFAKRSLVRLATRRPCRWIHLVRDENFSAYTAERLAAELEDNGL